MYAYDDKTTIELNPIQLSSQLSTGVEFYSSFVEPEVFITVIRGEQNWLVSWPA